jgi:AcrR family transcriptional regulator
MSATSEPEARPRRGNRRVAGTDPDKRRQILDGALAIFMARGFDASSMNDIAAAANVSKGTLYVYFEDKEHLFVALIERERESQKREAFAALEDDPDIAHALTSFGERLTCLLVSEFAMSAHRIVIGVAERMPDLGREFYENGPMQGAQRVAAYLDRKVTEGLLAIDDTHLAAMQFLDLCQSTLLRPRLFNAVREPPSPAEISRVVASAVEMFLARYGVEQAAAA